MVTADSSVRALAVLVASAVSAGCPGTSDLRAPASLPAAGTSIAIYRDRDDRVPTQAAYGPATTAQTAAGYGYRPPDAQPAAVPQASRSTALVVDRRWIQLRRGVHELALVGVASTLDPSSTWVQSLSDPEGTALIAQRYEGVRASADALLGMYIGRDVEVATRNGTVGGRLLGYDAAEITLVDREGTVRAIPRDGNVRSIGLDSERALGEPVLRPTLRAENEGRHLIEVAYEATGLAWWVDYGVDVSRADGGPAKLALVSRATVDNRSGMNIADARIALYAGTLGTKGKEEAALVWSGRAGIGRDEQKQFQIRRERRDIAGAIEYVYRGAVPDASTDDKAEAWGTLSHGQVRRHVTFVNAAKLGLGGVLPMGRALITMSRRAGGAPERVESYLAERVDIGDTARFDIGAVGFLQGERRQVRIERAADGKKLTERYELKVRNMSDQTLAVRIVEPLARSGTPTISKTEPKARRAGKQLEFPVQIEPGKTVTASYEVVYRW